MPLSATSNSSDVSRLCAEGLALLEARRFAEAHTLLLRARDLAPDDPLIYYYLGLLFSDLGRPNDALGALDASIRLDDGDAKIHNNRGSVLQILERLDEARSAFQRALDLRPDLDLPYVNLGKLLEQQGKIQEAVAIYDLALSRALDPGLFGQYRAAALGQSTLRSPDSWVSRTFDNFAPTFDAHLTSLQYEVPSRLALMLSPRVDQPLEILDLGCGTGLVGTAMAAHKHRLIGVDLSRKMLAQAKARNVYEALHVAEVHAFLRDCEAARFDAVCAADVFIYIGALEALFGDVRRVLRPGGWFAFSTEECADRDYVLLPTGRYAQSEAYIRRLAATAFTVVEARAATIRMETGTPLPGRLYLLQNA